MVHAPATVVVAVDAAGSADDAVEWAAAEAAARGLPLRIVHALAAPCALGLDGSCVSTARVLAMRGLGEQVLHDAAARAHHVVSDLEVTTEILHGPTSWAVEHAGRGAPLLVLGTRGRSAFSRLAAGSVSGHLAACAPCPAVIVRHQARRPEQRLAAPPAVVAAVVPGLTGLAAAQFAFQAARQRGIPLTLVHVAPAHATLDALAGVPSSCTATVGPDAIPDASINAAIARWRRECPAVEIRIKGPVGDPTTVLLAESSGAALLVLGTAGGKRRGARRLTSIGQRLLPKAQCPVAVVGHDAARAFTSSQDVRWWPERPASPL